MQNTTIAVDLGKSVFEVAVSTKPGRVSERYRLPRHRFLEFFAQRPAATVLLEACGSAHHWARRLQDLQHRVLLLPPREVRPYVTRNKTDRTDAKALLEAFRNDRIRPVPVKSVPQQTLVALHRLRSAWLAARTARINTVRGLLRELGIFIPVGSRQLVPKLVDRLNDPQSSLPEPLHEALHSIVDEIRGFELRMRQIERQLEALAAAMPVVARLRTIPGVGLLSATALVAFVGDIQRFPSGRHFASYLGLTPRERSSALQRRLGSISKRGDVYLRMLLVHGARSVLTHTRHKPATDRLRCWAQKLQQLRGHNKATVALANKLARIVWAVWRNDIDYAEQAKSK